MFQESMQIGARPIIGHFLAYTVGIAQTKPGVERMVRHAEVEVRQTIIPDIGSAVHSPLDHLTVPVAGRVLTCMHLFR